MGIVLQEAFLFSGTIAENIAFGRPDATREEIRAAAKAVGADDFIAGLRPMATTRGRRARRPALGGEEPAHLLRPRPGRHPRSSARRGHFELDVHTESKIEAGLRRLLAGRTAIVIAHRLSTIERAGQIVVMEHGRIVEQGSHAELLAARGHYRRLHEDWREQSAA